MITVLSLAISIGASTALFSVVDAALVRMLPVKDPDRLVIVNLGGWGDSASYRFFQVLKNGSAAVLDGVAAFATRPLTLTAESPERIEGAFVSGEFFSTLGVSPALGRGLTLEDDRAGTAGGVVVSGAFWRRRFGGDPAILGRTLRINGHTFPVVGVTPARFFGLDVGRAVDVYLPLTSAAELGIIDPGMMTGYFSTWLRLIGRLAPGIDDRRGAARLTVLLQEHLTTAADELDRTSGPSAERRQRLLSWEASLQPAGRGFGAGLRSRLSAPLVAASVLVGLVLLLVSANVGSLLLARAVARRREVAIRLSLGATRGRIARQVLTESACLAMTGALAAVLLAPPLAALVVRQLPADLGPVSLDVSLRWRVLCAATALSVFATVLISLAALIHSTRQRPAATLKLATAAVTERVRIGPQRALVVLQVAACVVVLVVAALFVQTLRNLGRIDLGLSSDRVLIASIDPATVGYGQAESQQLYRTVQDRLTTLPDVASASLIIGRPFLLRRGSGVVIDGQEVTLRWECVAPRFFETLGMSLKAGRDFTEADSGSAPFVGIVNETLAQRYFRGRNPVGEYIHRFAPKDGLSVKAPMQIVGVVRDVIHRSPRDQARPVLYAPAAQETFAISPATMVVRSRGEPLGLLESVRRAISQTDPDLALFDVKTFEQQIGETMWAERLLARVASGFGITALMLAGLGLCGTLSHAVTRRAREIGVRMALGADARAIRSSVVRDGMLLCGAGALFGVPVAIVARRYLTGLLYGIEPADWRPLLAAVLLLGGMAVLAAYLPARRASRVDPMEVLRAE